MSSILWGFLSWIEEAVSWIEEAVSWIEEAVSLIEEAVSLIQEKGPQSGENVCLIPEVLLRFESRAILGDVGF
ncbi:MAG: hypothetical protein EP343_33530 [Deltaproteobacteria bacterium]|nr:MAG: hypothetical protein EP343_33530 [Deltaproteobacteria bacterium]